MIYLDNAATSFPKPPEVIRAMAGVEEKMGGCWVCIIRSGFCSPQTAPKR